jgi:hypothetical protein
MDAMAKPWDIRVDFNTYPGPDLVYGNARHAAAGVVVRQGAVLTLGDDDWGVVRAEIIEFEPTTGTFTARLLGDIVPLDAGASSATA